MDHVVILRFCKIYDWLLKSSWDHFGLHQANKCHIDHEVQGPQKIHLKAYIIHEHSLLASFGMGEAKEVLWQKEPRTHGKEFYL